MPEIGKRTFPGIRITGSGKIEWEGAGSGSDYIFESRVVGDAYPRFRVRASGSLLWGIGSASPDVNLFRNSANVLKTGDLFICASLGVGNSASATTPGSVVKKIEVFDDAGNSLGFLAVYDAIT